ncbi:MAG: hypothetical protein HPPSJP_0750 [Candidatus Hepatoplasma scabrum]|nr:MAG: hypothetical protein HPPSJP_0750 [Candidatus Hepatoplasma sp.]
MFFINKVLDFNKMEKNNYYNHLIFKIENFINKKEYSKASKLIVDELKMPYVPLDVEAKLFDFEKIIFANLKNNKEYNSFSIYWYLNFLNNDKIDFFEKFEIIENFDNFNLKKYLSDFKNFFLNDKVSDLLKLKLLLIFKRQEIKENIDILFNDGKKELFDLSKVTNFYFSKEFAKDSKLIEDFLFKDPVIKNFSFLILEMFYFLKLREKENNKDLFYLKALYISAIFFKNNELQKSIKNKISNYDSFISEIDIFLIKTSLKK